MTVIMVGKNIYKYLVQLTELKKMSEFPAFSFSE